MPQPSRPTTSSAMRANWAMGVFDCGADSRDMDFSLGGGIIALPPVETLRVSQTLRVLARRRPAVDSTHRRLRPGEV